MRTSKTYRSNLYQALARLGILEFHIFGFMRTLDGAETKFSGFSLGCLREDIPADEIGKQIIRLIAGQPPDKQRVIVDMLKSYFDRLPPQNRRCERPKFRRSRETE